MPGFIYKKALYARVPSSASSSSSSAYASSSSSSAAAASAAPQQRHVQQLDLNQPAAALVSQIAGKPVALPPQFYKRRVGSYWTDSLNPLIARIDDQEQALKRDVIRTKFEVALDPHKSKECEGDVRLKNILHALDNIPGVTRSDDQKRLHKHFIDACLPKIYGSDWAANSQRVLAERGNLKVIPYNVCAITPRRQGKTYAVAMVVKVLLEFCPGIFICVFSTGQRASSALMETIKKFISIDENLRDRIIKNTEEELHLSRHALGKNTSLQSVEAKSKRLESGVSKLFCYPCSVTGKVYTTTLHTHTEREIHGGFIALQMR
jgi:hypothetical protein